MTTFNRESLPRTSRAVDMVGGVDALACLDHGIVRLNVDVGGRNNELFARDRRRGGDGIVTEVGSLARNSNRDDERHDKVRRYGRAPAGE